MHLLRLLQSEVRREFRIWWSYRFDALSWIALWAVGFPLLILVFDAVAGGLSREARLASLTGFLLWNLCGTMLGFSASMIESEASEGTIEGALLSVHSPAVWILVRNVAGLVFQIVETAVLAGILVLLLRIPMNLTLPVVLSILLTVWGAIGFGLALGGLALAFKQVSAFVSLANYLSLILSGALVPLDRLSFFALLKLVWPMTWGIDLVRQAQAGNLTLAAWAVSPDTWGVLAQSVVLTGLGLAVFQWGLARASRQGSLAAY